MAGLADLVFGLSRELAIRDFRGLERMLNDSPDCHLEGSTTGVTTGVDTRVE